MEPASKEMGILLKPTVKLLLTLLGVIPFTGLWYVTKAKEAPNVFFGEDFSLGPTGQLQQKLRGDLQKRLQLCLKALSLPSKLSYRSTIIWVPYEVKASSCCFRPNTLQNGYGD